MGLSLFTLLVLVFCRTAGITIAALAPAPNKPFPGLDMIKTNSLNLNSPRAGLYHLVSSIRSMEIPAFVDGTYPIGVSDLKTGIHSSNRVGWNLLFSRPREGDRESTEPEDSGVGNDRRSPLFLTEHDTEEAKLHRVSLAAESLWEDRDDGQLSASQANVNRGEKTQSEDNNDDDDKMVAESFTVGRYSKNITIGRPGRNRRRI